MPKQTKRGIAQDRRKKARYRPRKKFKKGLGSQGDWNRKRARKGSKKSNVPGIDVIEELFE